MCVPERGNPTGEHQDPEEPKTRLSQQRSGTTTGGAEPRGRTTLSLRDRFQTSRAATPQPARALNRVISTSQARGLAAESSTFEFLTFAASEQVADLTANAKNQSAAQQIAESDFEMCFSIIENVKLSFASHTDGDFDTTTVFQSLIDTLSDIDSELATRRGNFTFAQSLRVCRTLLQSLLSTIQAAQQRYAAEQREANPAQAPSPSGGWGKTGSFVETPLPETFEPPAPAGTPAKTVKRTRPSLLD